MHKYQSLAQSLRSRIGKHHALIGTYAPRAIYQRAEGESDAAVSLAKYLICHLSDRHDAVMFANAVGMPGYINLR